MTPNEETRSAPQLLRIPYHCSATGEDRQYLVFLPSGYESAPPAGWPVIFFLHGGGERGDGQADLDYVLVHGPLGEAWIYHRDLPFVMIGPQLPVFGMEMQLQMRAGVPKPVRRAEGPPPRRADDRPPTPMLRAIDPEPAPFGVNDDWGDEGPPGGWHLIRQDLLAMLDHVLRAYRTDPERVYLTGLSYGGYGTWDLATAAPERWAAIAPFCGDGNSSLAARLVAPGAAPKAEATIARQLPAWIFHGGRDPVVKPKFSYDMANALERAGHRTVRLTVHEDLGHDCWTRAYSGQDFYDWLLSHRRA